MPPTAATPSLPTTGYNPILFHPASQSIQMPATGQHSSIFVQPYPMMNVQQAHGPVQLTEGWTTFLPMASPSGQMMVPVIQQGLVGAPPTALPANQSYVSCQIPAAPHLSLPPPPPAQSLFNPLANSTNMEIVWHGVFENLFSMFQQSYSHNWNLMPLHADVPANSFHIFRDSAKVRFLCQTCGKAWTSMKGRVIFWFQLWPEHNQGLVLFKLYGQKCEKCNQKVFEHAMWYPEEVNKVVTNVFHAVGKAFYGLVEAPVYRERRKGKPRTQHNSSLCQACADKVCKEGICQ